jgi:hypothetical protein
VKKKKTTEKLIDALLRKMFAMVGKRSTKAWLKTYGKEEGWFRCFCWTPEKEKEFKVWVIKTLREKAGMTVRTAENNAMWFDLMYGWTTNPEQTIRWRAQHPYAAQELRDL